MSLKPIIRFDDAHEVIQYHRIILRPTSVVTERLKIR